MKDELSPRSRQMLGDAVAGERELMPDADRRRRLKRAVLQATLVSGAGSVTVAKAAAGEAAAGAAVNTAWLTVGKSVLVGFLASGGLFAAHSLWSPAASAPAAAPSLASASSAAAAAAPPKPIASTAAARSEVHAEPEASGAPRASALAKSPPSRPPSADGALRAELELITAAQAALRDGNAASALAALERYDRAFPAGQLSRERLAAEVFAACQLGDRARASRAAARFLEHDDDSALARRVKQACVFTGGSSR